MPILTPNNLEFFSRSADQTRRIGMRLGSLLKTGDLVCLAGDLGAGKTTLVQGIAQGWGSIDQATSPTFVLVNQYCRPDRASFFHLDAYRLAGAAEAEDLDIDLMLESGPLVVEWPERIDKALPPERLSIQMRWIAEEQRNMVFFARGTRYEKMISEFQKRTFGGST